MAKHVFSVAKRLAPAVLVLVSWCTFVTGVLETEPIAEVVLLSLARVLP